MDHGGAANIGIECAKPQRFRLGEKDGAVGWWRCEEVVHDAEPLNLERDTT